ncbi:centromere protein T [Turdus rufiventris]|nr:centromere protein T [Turdus rufiventris]
MADGRSRSRARAGLRRSGRHNARAAAQTGPSVENKSVRSTLAKQTLAVFPDLRNGTPRLLLRKVIQNQPQVSPLALQISNHEDAQEAHSEVPSGRVSSLEELQLPDVAHEDAPITVFHMKKKRKKLSISEFERAAERRLPQYQAQSALDGTIMARSLRMSVGSLLAPDTVEKRGLMRRPKTRKAIDMLEFEGRVEQNMLKSKGQSYLVDSQSASGIRSSMLTSDAEMMMNSTELFVQPQLDEQSQNKSSALEPQLSDLETAGQRSPVSDADQEESRLEGLVPGVRTNERRTPRHSKSLSLGHEHVDRMTPTSPETPAKHQEEKQDHSHQSNPMAQISFSEEMVFSKREITRGIGAESLGRHSRAFSSLHKPQMTPLSESDEQEDEPQDQAIMLELDDPVKEPAEDEAEPPAIQGAEVTCGASDFVHYWKGNAAGMLWKLQSCIGENSSLLTVCYMSTLQSRNLSLDCFSQGHDATHELFANCSRSPLQHVQPKIVSKRLGASQRKPREPQIPRSFIKNIFRHFAKMPVTKDAFKIVEKCSERYFDQLSNDLEAYSHHAGRKTVKEEDLEVLLRRQGLVTDRMPMTVLIERYLPLRYRKLLIPIAVSGNKVIPRK